MRASPMSRWRFLRSFSKQRLSSSRTADGVAGGSAAWRDESAVDVSDLVALLVEAESEKAA